MFPSLNMMQQHTDGNSPSRTETASVKTGRQCVSYALYSKRATLFGKMSNSLESPFQVSQIWESSRIILNMIQMAKHDQMLKCVAGINSLM